MKPQKFPTGALVRIAPNLGPGRGHFIAGVDALIVGSYNELCGRSPNGHKEYELYIEGYGISAWYEEKHLTLLKPPLATMLYPGTRTWANFLFRKHRGTK